jgi:hypothetical protein
LLLSHDQVPPCSTIERRMQVDLLPSSTLVERVEGKSQPECRKHML